MAYTFDAVAATQITKQYFSGKKVETFCYTDPLVGLMLREPDCSGANYNAVINNALLTSVSASAAVAFSTGSSDQYTKFTMPWAQGYVGVQIDGFVAEQTAKDEGSFVKLVTKSVQNGLKAAGVHIAGAIYGNGSGVVAQVTAINGLVCTVGGAGSALSGIRALSLGSVLQGSTTMTPSSVPMGGTVTITAIDYNAGTFTTNIAIGTGIPGFVVGNYVGLNGDIGQKIIGVQGWIPDANNRPTASENFGGLPQGARALDPVALAGNYLSGNSAPKEETLIQAAALIDQSGGKATHLFCNHLDAADIAKTFMSRGVVPLNEKTPGNPTIGFDGFQIMTSMGPIKVFTSAFEQQGSAIMTQLDTWVLASVNPVPHILEEMDGLTWCRVPGANSYMLRIGYGATTFNSMPWASCSILF